MYQATLANGIVITQTRSEHAEQLETLQETVFPTLADDEIIRAEHYRHHVQMFPEGQFVALDGDRVVGMCSSIRLDFDFEHSEHTFADLLQGGYMTAHQPDGVWLYGMDMGVHPDYRRQGISRGLYDARLNYVRAEGLKGIVGGGMLSGYGAVKDQMPVETYYQKLVAGEIQDPTISAQRRIGFELRGLLPNYVQDPVCANYGVLIVLEV